MGTVYLGRHAAGDGIDSPPVGPLVAIKVIRPDLANIPEFRRRFEREARAAQRVHHAYTAAVLDVDTSGSRPYLVTEYIDGPTLSARVQDRGPLSVTQLEWFAKAVASALLAIHQAGLVHRDLKPGNILLSTFGARVIDFGIAHTLGASSFIVTMNELVRTLSQERFASASYVGSSYTVLRANTADFRPPVDQAYAEVRRMAATLPDDPRLRAAVNAAETQTDGLAGLRRQIDEHTAKPVTSTDTYNGMVRVWLAVPRCCPASASPTPSWFAPSPP